MTNWKKMMDQETFRYIDQTPDRLVNEAGTLASFAIDDTLAESVSKRASSPVMRLWRHPDTAVLGIVDGRLPYLEDGVCYLRREGQNVVIRNSGGLAVPLDAGVLNLSIVLPDIRHISIYEAYDAMVGFIRYMLRDVTDDIEAYEIPGSYCPGDYDLSIGGKKFAGISQRRIKDSAAVQIYMDVTGDSRERARLIRDFYAAGKQDARTKFVYPDVQPETMASLSELLETDMTVEGMKKRALAALKHVTTSITTNDFSDSEMQTFNWRLDKMQQRNEAIASIRCGGE